MTTYRGVKPDIRWTRGNWYIEVQRARWCVVNAKTGFTDAPVVYGDGTVAYDRPEQVPQYVQTALRRLVRRLNGEV